jgi:hypothetical protein
VNIAVDVPNAEAEDRDHRNGEYWCAAQGARGDSDVEPKTAGNCVSARNRHDRPERMIPRYRHPMVTVTLMSVIGSERVSRHGCAYRRTPRYEL